MTTLVAFLGAPGPGGMPWWQLAALPVALTAAWIGAGVLARFVAGRLTRFAARTQARWDDELAGRMHGPIRLATFVALCATVASVASLPTLAKGVVEAGLRGCAVLALSWAVSRAASVASDVAMRSPWASTHPAGRALVPVALRAARVAITIVAAVAVLSALGYPVGSLLVGLGVGGIALALASQKTIENLFGAISIAADQPFREGDFVRIDDVVGTIECIGLRSTRIRTLDRTVVAIPNGRLADMRTESFAARDRIRLACTVGLVYGTTGRQMRQVLRGLEAVLRSHPRIWPDAVVVRFKEFAAWSLDIEVMAWFQTSDWSEFQLIRQDVLLAFMEVVEGAGCAFAFPTRTLHVVSAPELRVGSIARVRTRADAGVSVGK